MKTNQALKTSNSTHPVVCTVNQTFGFFNIDLLNILTSNDGVYRVAKQKYQIMLIFWTLLVMFFIKIGYYEKQMFQIIVEMRFVVKNTIHV